MDRLSFLRELKLVEEGIGITDPVGINNAVAYVTVPDRNEPLGKEAAVFENWFDGPSEALVMGNQSEETVTAIVRFSAYDADFDRACEIAVAYFDAALSAFRQQMPEGQRFKQTIANLNNVRTEGQVPTNFGGRPGWEMSLDLTMFSRVF